MVGLTREIRRGQDGLILHVRVANKKAGFTSSCLLADSAI